MGQAVLNTACDEALCGSLWHELHTFTPCQAGGELQVLSALQSLQSKSHKPMFLLYTYGLRHDADACSFPLTLNTSAGRFKLATLVQYVPLPVVAGYLGYEPACNACLSSVCGQSSAQLAQCREADQSTAVTAKCEYSAELQCDIPVHLKALSRSSPGPASTVRYCSNTFQMCMLRLR